MFLIILVKIPGNTIYNWNGIYTLQDDDPIWIGFLYFLTYISDPANYEFFDIPTWISNSRRDMNSISYVCMYVLHVYILDKRR